MIRAFQYLAYSWGDFLREREVKRRFYGNSTYALLDRSLRNFYLFKNPYSISKRFSKRKKESQIHTYGETPLTTLEKIAKEADICSSDTFLELGCGRGRGVFFLSHFFGCRAVGVERIPIFVKIAEHVALKFDVKNVSFSCCDMCEMEYPRANVVYLYGTCLADREIEKIIFRCKKLPEGSRIVTVSYPLTEYDLESTFRLERSFPVTFPWGETEAYIQIVGERNGKSY
jgi:SAM-dependent methyltransferase